MAYDLFLFDFDDTLMDFAASERHAFTNALKAFDIHDGHTELLESYKTFSLALWARLERGEITRDVLRSERFRQTFEKHALSAPADEVGHKYLELLPEICEMIEGSEEICEYLSRRGKIGIITNGFLTVQKRRLAISPISRYVDFVLVSEECGFTKPDVRFFEHAAQMVPGFSKSKTLVVGDRLEADILGANGFGVASCWFNPKGAPLTGTAKPTYQIRKLEELKAIIP
ncbi:MAG: YjjG family noncanonical pyrimidine nucleotidase [Bdellovibrionota bacterium]